MKSNINNRQTAEMAEPEINVFLTHLAVKEKVSTTMIYTHVLNRGGHEVRGTQPDGWAIVRFIQSV